MSPSTGAAFDAAAIVGPRVFEAEPTTLTRHLSMERDKFAPLPQSVRAGTAKVKDAATIFPAHIRARSGQIPEMRMCRPT